MRNQCVSTACINCSVVGLSFMFRVHGLVIRFAFRLVGLVVFLVDYVSLKVWVFGFRYYEYGVCGFLIFRNVKKC